MANKGNERSSKLTLSAFPEVSDEYESSEQLVDAIGKVIKWASGASARIDELENKLSDQDVSILVLAVQGLKRAQHSLDASSREIERLRRDVGDRLERVGKVLGRQLGLAAVPSRGRPAGAAPATNGTRTRTSSEEMQDLRRQVLTAISQHGPITARDLRPRMEGFDRSLSPILNALQRNEEIRISEGVKGGAKWVITAAGKKQLPA